MSAKVFGEMKATAAVSYEYPKMSSEGMSISIINVNPAIGNRNIDTFHALGPKEKFQFINAVLMGSEKQLTLAKAQTLLAIVQTCMTATSFSAKAAHDHLKYRLFADTIEQQLNACLDARNL